MKTLPPNKSFKELGIDPKGKKFVFMYENSQYFKEGDICEIDYDDGSICPIFRMISNGRRWHECIERFALLNDRSWDSLTQEDVGAKFKDESGGVCVILEVSPNGRMFVSAGCSSDLTGTFTWYHINRAKKYSYAFIDETPETKAVRKMTVREVSELVGETVEIVE